MLGSRSSPTTVPAKPPLSPSSEPSPVANNHHASRQSPLPPPSTHQPAPCRQSPPLPPFLYQPAPGRQSPLPPPSIHQPAPSRQSPLPPPSTHQPAPGRQSPLPPPSMHQPAPCRQSPPPAQPVPSRGFCPSLCCGRAPGSPTPVGGSSGSSPASFSPSSLFCCSSPLLLFLCGSRAKRGSTAPVTSAHHREAADERVSSWFRRRAKKILPYRIQQKSYLQID
jgi:hypothetical protein